MGSLLCLKVHNTHFKFISPIYWYEFLSIYFNLAQRLIPRTPGQLWFISQKKRIIFWIANQIHCSLIYSSNITSFFWVVTPTGMRLISWPATLNCIYKNHNNPSEEGALSPMIKKQIPTKAKNWKSVRITHAGSWFVNSISSSTMC